MRLSKTSEFPVPPERVFERLHDLALMPAVFAPFVRLRAIDPKPLPERLTPQPYVFSLRAFGFLPLGREALALSYPVPEPGEPLPRYALLSHGSGDLARRLELHSLIEPAGPFACRLTETLTLEARGLTPILWLWARLYLDIRRRYLLRLVPQERR